MHLSHQVLVEPNSASLPGGLSTPILTAAESRNAWVPTVAFSVALLPFRLYCTWLPKLLSFLSHRSNSPTFLTMT